MTTVLAIREYLTPDLYFFLHLLQIGIFLFLLRHLDVYEREPTSVVVTMFVWGALGAGLLAPPLNGWVSEQLPPDVDLVFGAALSAPVMEEFAKGIALVVAFFVARWSARRFGTTEFAGVTDGIVYGAAVGLGFAFTENILFFLQFAAEAGFDVGLEVFLFRVDFTGVQSLLHPLFSAMLGAGIGLASASRGAAAKVLYPLTGFLLAVLLHASWNGLPQVLLVREFGFDVIVQWFGEGVPVALANELEAAFDQAFTISRWVFYFSLLLGAAGFVLWLRYERQVIRYELDEEVSLGHLSRQEYELLPDFRRRLCWYASLVWQGHAHRANELRGLHDELVRLAMLKWRVRRLERDPGWVELLRAQIAARRRFVDELATAGLPPPPPQADYQAVVGDAAREGQL